MTHTPEQIVDFLYRAYGSGTGDLFGIPPSLKESVSAIVKLVVEKSRDDCAGLNPGGYRECVEALKMLFDEDGDPKRDQPLDLGVFSAAQRAIAHAKPQP